MMRKRLRKAMLHIPLLKLRPELCEQEESIDGQENYEMINDDCDDGANVNDNATSQSHSEDDTGAARNYLQSLVKRIRFKKMKNTKIIEDFIVARGNHCPKHNGRKFLRSKYIRIPLTSLKINGTIYINISFYS